MSAGTDFLRLYLTLGIQPGCSLQALRQAYRRRVGELHPDRRGNSQHGTDRLMELNLQYAAALEFHRLHGRLPGAKPPVTAALTNRSLIRIVPPSPTRPGSIPVVMPLPLLLPPVPARPEGRPARRDRPNRLLVAALTLAAIAATWHLLPRLEAEPEPGPALAAVVDPDGLPARPPGLLELGMEAEMVIELLGQPIRGADGDGHWLYGPSWVRFECGQVTDWYSSPLHPLRVADARPAASAAMAGGLDDGLAGGLAQPPARRRAGCRPGVSRDASPLVAPPTGDAAASQHRGSA